MALWEYKMITSGRGGFASPALMEKFLNDLGKEDWEIVSFQIQPDNILAFNGLARRTTQRDWTLEDAVAAAAKTEADKLRAEFENKFKSATSAAPAGMEEKIDPPADKAAPEDSFRKLRDTERDHDPDAPDEEHAKDEWDQLGAEEELPSFFDAMKPHMRRNQRGPGMSVGVDFLAKKWDFSDADVIGALKECGFVVPDDEDAPSAYVEYDGDVYWVNINRRGELWINTKEKPRPVFRMVKATPFAAPEGEAPAPAQSPRNQPQPQAQQPAEMSDTPSRRPDAPVFVPKPREAAKLVANADADVPAAPAPAAPATVSGPPAAGTDLLDRVRPLMRRNRRGPGGSGSMTFLARGLRCGEPDLMAEFAKLGMVLPAAPTDQPVYVEIGEHVWWLNQDSRGGVWINGREQFDEKGQPIPLPTAQESAATGASTGASEPGGAAPATPGFVAAVAAIPPPPAPANVLSGVRLLLKETKTGGFAGKLDRVAEDLAKSPDDLLGALLNAGLKVPEKARQKPVFIEHAGEIFWLNKNAKDELWVNAKASKFAGGEGEEADGEKKGARRPRPTKKKSE
ncbi:MAG: hypothetical protein H7343_02340 [Undibacterium sp.]|nr:hypothetical protein [Opitutaceae bacterium]